MLGLLMRLLPPATKALVQLALRMVDALDTPEERQEVAEFGMKMLSDGSVSITEWSAFGKKLGIFRLGAKNGK